MKRRGILEFMKNCIKSPVYNVSITDNAKIISLIENLFKFFYLHYGLKDIEENGKHKHQLRFYLLYMDKNEMSYSQIMEETMLGITNEALKHHVRNYNLTMLNYIKEESSINEDYVLLLSEYLKNKL